MYNTFNRFYGIDLLGDKTMPEFRARMRLSVNVEVTDEFRSQFNEWLLDFFGQERAFMTTPYGIIAHPNNIEWLKNKANKHQVQNMDLAT